ncbi:MAG: hypothetical protein ABI847_05980, partial [Anaerolineales bacterium]
MSTSSSPRRFPWLALIGIGALVLVGLLLLALALINLVGGGPKAPLATATRVATQIVQIPTTTPLPPTATLEPTATATEIPSPTEGPAATE